MGLALTISVAVIAVMVVVGILGYAIDRSMDRQERKAGLR